MIAIQVLAGAIVLATIVLFVPYWRSVWALPSGRRPLTPEYDRLGRRIGLEENPDFWEEEPDEERAGSTKERAAEG